jgi:hypothetical protein
MSVPPIDPANLRAIFDDADSAIPPARPPRKGPLMRLSLIASLALLALAPAASDSRSAPATYDPSSISRLVEPCRQAARASFNAATPAVMDAYIDNLLAHRDRDRDELLACAAYLAGARDMAEGRILPIDRD